jgi:hypothetical protein
MSNNPLEKWASLIAATAGWVSTHDEADAKSDCIQELAAALRAELERVAELEPDARLGKAFRVMRPEGQGYGWLIFKRTYASDAMWDQFIEAWEKAFQAALEAAQKEET